MWKKIAIISSSALLIAIFTILIIHRGSENTVRHSTLSNSVQPNGLIWTTSPDWILKLAEINSDAIDQHWVAQMIEAVAEDRFNSGDYDQAAQILEIGYQLFPQNVTIVYQLGLDQLIVDPQRATQYLSIAANLDQSYAALASEVMDILTNSSTWGVNLFLGLGKVLGKSGEWKVGQVLFEKATDLDPKNEEGWVLLGQAQDQNGQNGLPAYLQAQKLDPGLDVVKASLGSYYASHGNQSNAIGIYSSLQKSQPSQPIWDIELGNLYSQAGDLVTAYGYYVDAIDLEPQNVNYWIALVNFCSQYQIYIQEVGLPAARKAVSLAPDDPNALASMGELLFLQGDADSAIKFLGQAVELDTWNPAYLFSLAESYLHKKDLISAFPIYQEIVSLEGITGYGALARQELIQNFSIKP